MAWKKPETATDFETVSPGPAGEPDSFTEEMREAPEVCQVRET